MLLIASVILLARCAAMPPVPPPPATLDLLIKAGADQNPDASGAPAPVVVRLYYLAATGRFASADAYALMQRDRATLGDDRVGSEEIVLRPGEAVTVTRDLKPGVQFLGVAVLFRDIDRATWRAVAPVAGNGPTKLVLTLDGLKAAMGPP
jgi:type VI secretion system protein VasD